MAWVDRQQQQHFQYPANNSIYHGETEHHTLSKEVRKLKSTIVVVKITCVCLSERRENIDRLVSITVYYCWLCFNKFCFSWRQFRITSDSPENILTLSMEGSQATPILQ